MFLDVFENLADKYFKSTALLLWYIQILYFDSLPQKKKFIKESSYGRQKKPQTKTKRRRKLCETILIAEKTKQKNPQGFFSWHACMYSNKKKTTGKRFIGHTY